MTAIGPEMTPTQRLSRLYQLRERLDAEILAAEILAKQSPRRVKRRSRYDPAPCGTEGGYQRHRYLGEHHDLGEECGCREAHRAHNREVERQRKLRRQRLLIGLAS